MRSLNLLSILLLGLATSPAIAEDTSARFTVRQSVVLGPLSEAPKEKIEWWIAIPADSPHQEILDFAVVSAPGEWTIVREREHGNRFLLVEIANTKETRFETVVDFEVRRHSVHHSVDPKLSKPIDDARRPFFSEELLRTAPHMAVTEDLRQLAAETCGDETNVARQARLLLDRVANMADHYSKDPTKPSCGVGDAGACVLNGGGCCTDLHSLFIALARARGIPARLQMGYRLLSRNQERWVDPGYRCWAEYFVPGHGWIPADIVEADAEGGLGKDRWFTGLTVERVWLNQGRDYLLPRKNGTTADSPRINHMSIGYAEVDGKPVRVLPEGDLPSQVSRTVRFVRTVGGA